MLDFLGIQRSRLPIAIAMVIALAAGLSWLQGRFETGDVKKAITLAMSYKTTPSGPTIFEALAKKNEGDPRCDGEVVSTFFGDVKVRCSTVQRPDITYDFRILLDGKRQPRPDNEPARVLLSAIANGALAP
jgi:hypothetical protein